jgi:hypothetical protein
MKMAVSGVEKANFNKSVGCSFDAKLVAVVKNGMVGARAKGHPRTPAKRGQKRVGGTVVICKHNSNN